MEQPTRHKLALLAAFAAVGLSSLLVAGKATVWLSSGSTALLASMVDSLIDVLVSLSNLFAIHYAYRPADHDHRYGHGKAEGVAALAQAAFICGSCAFVLLEAVRHFSAPAPIEAVGAAVGVLIAAILGTILLTKFQDRVSKATGSLAVEADSAHYKSDLVTNVAVLVSILIGQKSGLEWVDPLTALLVAGWLLFSARTVAIKAINMLLDREIEDHERLPLLNIVRETPGVEGMHDFRTRRSGSKILVSFDIEVDPDLTLAAAHEISRLVEERILAKFPHTEVMIHLDPRGDITDSRHKRIEQFHVE